MPKKSLLKNKKARFVVTNHAYEFVESITYGARSKCPWGAK